MQICACAIFRSNALLEQKRNVMAHAQKPDLVFQRNGRVHLYRQGCQFSRLLAAEVCASAVVMLDRPCPIQCTTAGNPLHSPFSPSLLHPCVSVCHHIPFLLYYPSWKHSHTIHPLTHYTLLALNDAFSLCVGVEQFAPANSNPVVPHYTQQPPHRATHADHPAGITSWSVVYRQLINSNLPTDSAPNSHNRNDVPKNFIRHLSSDKTRHKASKACTVFYFSNTAIVGSNPTRCMD